MVFASMLRYVAVLSVLVSVVYGFQSLEHHNNNKNLFSSGKISSRSSSSGSSKTRTVLLESDGKKRDMENVRGNQNGDLLSKIPNPIRELGDMLQNFDDVLDDFLYKRMGNGEVFNGKRKYKPSGRPNTEGKYNGMGLSDKLRIDITREMKEELLERRRLQREQQQQQRK